MGDITDNNVEHCYVRVRNGTATLDEVCDQLSHLTNESLQTLLMIEDAYGDPLITLLLRNYGFDACIAVYDTIAANRIVLEELFRYTITTGGSTHPIDWCFRLFGLDKTFEMIDLMYDRRFSLLYEIREYSDPSTIIDHLLLTPNDTLMLVDMIAKYNVTKEEFDFYAITGRKLASIQ